ncbi:MAG: hypothetical protein IPK13_06865 [Deltaproteobacteria bacterium]|nr:hypothetical protein [Deltaproteobacteria bacterium]
MPRFIQLAPSRTALVVAILVFGCSENPRESTPSDSGSLDASSSNDWPEDGLFPDAPLLDAELDETGAIDASSFDGHSWDADIADSDVTDSYGSDANTADAEDSGGALPPDSGTNDAGPSAWSPCCGHPQLRSVTFYDHGSSSAQRYVHIESALPAIRRAGFNALWLVSPWTQYNPRPLVAPPEYSPDEFRELRRLLTLLRANGMRALIGLNYLGSGWAPDGIDACTWITDPVMYAAFETYVARFLQEIREFSDLAYILVFTENAEPCGMANADSAVALAELLRATLGSLPHRLDPALRAEFRIGYHDYSLINLGWAGGDSPIASPMGFDFLSMVAYGLDRLSDTEIAAEIDRRAGRFRALYPSTPLIIGESGASACDGNDANQARVARAIVEHATSHGMGSNIWGWRPGPPGQECVNPVFGGLAVTNQDGSIKQAVDAIADVFRPRITGGGVVTSFDPWAVWLTGTNFGEFLSVQVFDGANAWSTPRSVTLGSDCTWLSFSLPANVPPSRCNLGGQSCPVSAVVTDVRSGLASPPQDVTLPAQ